LRVSTELQVLDRTTWNSKYCIALYIFNSICFSWLSL